MRILIAGAGGIAHRHVSVLDRIEEAEVVGVMDIVAENARALADEAGAAPYTDLAEAVDASQPDALLLLTPRTVREGPISFCIERGLPVFVEKPPCECLSTGRRIHDRLQEAGLVHSVGFMHRYGARLERVLQHLREQRLSSVNILIRTPLALTKMWEHRPYPFQWRRSGGIVGEVGIHYIDIIRYICGAEPVEYTALGSRQALPDSEATTTDDAVACSMRMANGVMATVCLTWAANDWYAAAHLATDAGHATVELMPYGADLAAWGTAGDESFRDSDACDEYEQEHRAFLRAVQSGSMEPVRSPYADALKTFEATARVNALLYGENAELG
jgi:predicted dehydrogenase